jgi:hypothetical protein
MVDWHGVVQVQLLSTLSSSLAHPAGMVYKKDDVENSAFLIVVVCLRQI